MNNIDENQLLSKIGVLFDEKMNAHSQGIKTEIESIRSEMGKFKNQVLDMVSTTSESNREIIKEEVCVQVREVIGESERKFEEKLTKFNEKLESLEYFKRKRNIIIWGLGKLPEYEDRVNAICRLFKDKLGVAFSRDDIEFITKLNKNKDDGGILIGFVSYQKKGEILRNRTKLKGTKIFIDQDYSKEMVEKRKELIDIMIRLRKIEEKVYIQHDKIMINGKAFSKDEALQFEKDRHNLKNTEEMEISQEIPRNNKRNHEEADLDGTNSNLEKMDTSDKTPYHSPQGTPVLKKGKLGGVVQSRLDQLWNKAGKGTDTEKDTNKETA